MSDEAPRKPTLSVNRSSVVVLIAVPAALFAPSIVGLPGDAGLLAVIAAIGVLRWQALGQALRSSAHRAGMAAMA